MSHARNAVFLGLATLAALGLAAAPAGAQTLSGFKDGDAVTVSGTGTTGTYQGGSLSDNVNSYTATSTPGAAVAVNAGYFTLESGGTLSGGGLSLGDGLDAGVNALTVLGAGAPSVLISGGTVNGYYAVNVGGGIVTITGGHITGSAQGAGLLAQASTSPANSGTIDVYGTFTDHAPNSSVTGIGVGTVSGTLADGEAISTYDAFRRALLDEAGRDSGESLVLDLTGVDYTDGRTWTLIAQAGRQMAAQGRAFSVALTPDSQPERVYLLRGLWRVVARA